MTCIVGIVKDGKVWMGGDRLVSSGETKFTGCPKVYILKWDSKPEFLIGDAGGHRASDIVQTMDIIGSDLDDPYLNVVKVLIPSIRKALIENGAMGKFDDGTDQGNAMLVGHRGRLFRVCSAFSVAEPAEGYSAVGSASDIAFGAFSAMENMGMTWHPKNKLAVSLEAAERHSRAVSGPFDFLEL
jgi:ATP-dependent protease HslVU (ClpYQ) peptidase subunit